MNEVNTTALLERVKRLERQNKLIKLTGIVVALVMAFVLLVGAKEKVPKEIVAESFRVVDTQGRLRASLSSGLTLWDERGKSRVGLAVTQKGPILGLFDERGKPRVGLSVTKIGPLLLLYDEREKLRAGLVVDQEGSGLDLYDKNGKLVFTAP